MDPFTQRMLERARARQEKIDQKLANSGQSVPKRKPLAENIGIIKTDSSPVKTQSRTQKETVLSPKRSSLKTNSPVRSPSRKSVQKSEQLPVVSPQRPRNDVIVTKREFKSPKNSLNRRNSDVSVEINITHRNDIQIEVQVEEREVPINIVNGFNMDSNVVVKEIEDVSEDSTTAQLDKESTNMNEEKTERQGLRNNMKSRLDRLGNLYSDTPTLSSPIHRTEMAFSSATPPAADSKPVSKTLQKDGKKKFGRLAALADEINNWEDDLSHHSYQPEVAKKKPMGEKKSEKLDASTLDVSIHSIKDINSLLQTATTKTQASKPGNTRPFTKPATKGYQKLETNIVAELESQGYKRVSASQSRLVYDFTKENADPDRQEPNRASTTPSAAAAPKMATMVVTTQPVNPAVSKKPSIKKYKAPTPPKNNDEPFESEIDKENNAVHTDDSDEVEAVEGFRTKPAISEKPMLDKGSPAMKRLAPKLNANDRNSVLSKAAMFEVGSPKAKDPAEMSLRERKALFEKNKGAAIVPKAPFGLAPSVKTLHGDKGDKSARPVVHTSAKTSTKSNNSTSNSRSNSKEQIADDNVSQSSVGGGIKGKLAALFSKEQTISETTIANKFKLEREKEMEMLQNRFHYKSNEQKHIDHNESDDDHGENDPSEKAPLMGSTISLPQANKKPEIIANIPKVTFDDRTRSETNLNQHKEANRKEINKVVGAQPVKRRSSQDSPAVLSVLDDIKRIKVNKKEMEANGNGTNMQQPTSLYPHLSDIETDNSHNHDDHSDCGGSSTDKSNENLNKSDNWAETSFGREVMNVVKKNNVSYQKAVRESGSDSSQSGCDSELDDMLDEALNDESEGPTPPKVKHGGSLSSATSFVYQEKSQFKSPLKTPPPPVFNTPATSRVDRGNELVHSVSFYRRMQNASTTPLTPLRIVKHSSPERDIPPTPEDPAINVTTVRQRIKELQNEILKQQTVISQASQALNLCAATIEFSGSTEQAEGERLLLLATHRRQACLHEVQRLQVEGAGPAATAGMATLHINTFSVPLRREYMRQLNADGAVGHHVVCLLKCRDRVLATSMQLTKPTTHLLHFPDEIRMDGLNSDFKVTVEVYLLQASKEILPHDVKYHITNKKANSKLLTPKSKVSELKTPRVQSPAGPLAVRSPQFQLHGYCIFALQQATRKNFTLNKVPHSSPLEGSVHMDITARLLVSPPTPHSAFLTAFDDVSGLGAWHRRWFQLQAPRLLYWKYPDDVNKKMPIGDIDLSTVVSEKVVKAPRDLCARPNTILLESSVPAGLIVPDSGSLVYVKRSDGSIVRRHLLAADTPKDRDVWLDCLNKALEYVRCCGTDDE